MNKQFNQQLPYQHYRSVDEFTGNKYDIHVGQEEFEVIDKSSNIAILLRLKDRSKKLTLPKIANCIKSALDYHRANHDKNSLVYAGFLRQFSKVFSDANLLAN